MAISANEQDKLTNALWLITKTNPFNIFDTPGDFRPLLSFISDSQSRVQFNLETHFLYNRVELCGYTDIVIEATLMNLKSPPPYLLWPSQLSLGASFQRRKVISWLKAPGWNLSTRRQEIWAVYSATLRSINNRHLNFRNHIRY